jgi:eukaryotic-like serine/threonine-protein kinase
MSRIKKLIIEVHRRSLWQVTGVYLAVSWGVIQVVDFLTREVGLPHWTPTMAFVLLLIGLPVVLATAIVQEGAPRSGSALDPAPDPAQRSGHSPAEAVDTSPDPAPATVAPTPPASGPSGPDAPGLRRLLTWRNAIIGGVGAFALLGFAVSVYFFLWSAGIGPVGNLVAQGLITEGERVVLADFADDTGEGLGQVVTEALRIDLGGTAILSLMEEADVAPVLARMQLEPGTPLTAELAREVAVREGIEAVLDGGVTRVGTGYLITAALRDAASGRSLAGFRVTAANLDDVIPTLNRLSRDIREKSGESLRSIRAGEPLEQVTTRSLEALRLFTEANRAFEMSDYPRTIALLEQCVALDPEFAMAWRRMAAAYNNTGTDRARQRHAATQAFQHRDRLTPRERHLTEAFYYSQVELDRTRTIAAYENVLRLAPNDPAALNNLANVYLGVEDFERASALYRRAVDGPGRSNTAYQNFIQARIGAQDLAGAVAVFQEYQEAYPEDRRLPEFRYWTLYYSGDLEGARAVAEAETADPSLPAALRSTARRRLGALAYRQGRLDEGRSHMLAAERLAAGVTPGFALSARGWTAFFESFMGDREWARRHLREALDDGTFWGLAPEARDWVGMGLGLADLGDREAGIRVLEAWDETLTARGVGEEGRGLVRYAWILLDLRTGEGQGALEALRALQVDGACSLCYRDALAMAAEREGRRDEAITLFRAIRDEFNRIGFDDAPMRTWAALHLGPLYERAGDPQAAIEAYRYVEELWAGADARGMERVREARARIAALGG